MKSHDLIVVPVLILLVLNGIEVSGIPGVAVKCVDIRRNTKGEGNLLGIN